MRALDEAIHTLASEQAGDSCSAVASMRAGTPNTARLDESVGSTGTDRLGGAEQRHGQRARHTRAAQQQRSSGATTSLRTPQSRQLQQLQARQVEIEWPDPNIKQFLIDHV